jgi:hypothetical protein
VQCRAYRFGAMLSIPVWRLAVTHMAAPPAAAPGVQRQVIRSGAAYPRCPDTGEATQDTDRRVVARCLQVLAKEAIYLEGLRRSFYRHPCIVKSC